MTWKPIEDYEGIYEVSDTGLVRSLERVVKASKGMQRKPERVLKPEVSIFGYERVWLSKDNKAKKLIVHRLVAQAFIPNPLNFPQVNHIDGNKTNNRVENLEWCTNQENITHAVSIGRIGKGESNSKAKLTDTQVVQLRLDSSELTTKQLAEKYGISQANTYHILRRMTWKHL